MPSSCHSSLALVRVNRFQELRGRLRGAGTTRPSALILRAMVDREGACRLPPCDRTHHTLQAPGSLPWASRSLRIRVIAASVSAPHLRTGVLGALEAAARARACPCSSATRRTR